MDVLVIETPAFAPNHLSAEGPRTASVSNDEAVQVRAILRDGWAFDARDVRRLVTGGTSAANYLIDGRLTLKMRADVTVLVREVALLRRASDADVPVPALYPATNGCDLHRAGTNAAALFDFVPGTHFRGLSGEIGQAAAAFAAVARCFAGESAVATVDWNGAGTRIRTALAAVPQYADDAAQTLLDKTFGLLEPVLRQDARATFDAPCAVHTDLHPLNLLFAQGRVAAVLDFEDVAIAPRAVGAGFALLKLGREALSRATPAMRRDLARDLVAEWRAVDPIFIELLAAGAHRRVLANIATILEAWRLRGDVSMNHGLAGQIESLAEANFLFGNAA